MKQLRFAPTRWSTAVEYIVKHIRPPSHPSTTSQSQDLESGTETSGPSRARSNGKDIGDYVLENRPKSRFRSTGGSKQESNGSRGRRKTGSRTNSNSRFGDEDDENNDNTDRPPEPVSHIVVDNDFAVFVPPPRSDSGSTRTPGGGTGLSEHGGTGTESADGMSIRRDRRSNWIQRTLAYEIIVERVAPSIAHFFDSSFQEPKKEKLYQKEQWFTNKTGALASTSFYFLAWVLTCALSPRPLVLLNYVAYIGVAGLFTLPLVFFVAGDFPRRRPLFWNIWLMIASWIWAYILIGEMYECGFFTPSRNTCGQRNFLNMMGWAYGPPVLALLTMQQARFYAAFGASVWAILVGVLLMTAKDSPNLFYRNIVQFLLFHGLLIATSFLRERSDRTLFSLRQQLKIQYRATQSAQVAERKAADSKKRFVSYIFHEARIPLNTALLAFQNLQGERVFDNIEKDQVEMIDALSSSLTMMEKVLNDVLSFSRMEAGRFKQIAQPFNFHQAIQLVAMSHRAQAAGSGLSLIVELDEEVDRTAGGVFIGDEMRLRQVISNLVSNAIKFTPAGHVKIKTNLLYPRAEATPVDEKLDPVDKAAESAQHLARELQKDSETSQSSDSTRVGHVSNAADVHDRRKSESSARTASRTDHVIVRIEVQDQGVGLRNSDVVDSQLFTAFVQSEVGRRQGGKGFGLGLAIVRAIVKLSGGRLGVESQSGVGSTFWVEFPYSLPPPKSRNRDSFAPPLGRLPTANLPIVTVQDKAYDTESRPGLAPTTSSFMPLLPPASEGSMPVASEDVMDSFAGTAIGELQPGVLTPEPHPIFVDPFMAACNAGPSSPMPATPAATEPALDTRPLRALVVDDDQLTRKLMSRMLVRMGHSVQQAENGQIALDILVADFDGARTIDVCFLDNQMPIKSGVEVVDELRRMGSPLFVVGCTGNALREDQDEYLEAGVDKVLTKPIKEKDLKEMVNHARQRQAGLTTPPRVETPS